MKTNISPRQEKGKNRRIEGLIKLHLTVPFFSSGLCIAISLSSLQNFAFKARKTNLFQYSTLPSFSLRMATLRTKRKLAAIARDNQERSPWEQSKTESRILGSLSEIDKFLLNPPARLQLVTVLGTSGNIMVQNQEPTGDRS